MSRLPKDAFSFASFLFVGDRARREAGGFLQNVHTSRTESLFRASKGVNFRVNFRVDFRVDFRTILGTILGLFLGRFLVDFRDNFRSILGRF